MHHNTSRKFFARIRRYRVRSSRQRGSALVEFAVFSPLLALMAVGAVDYSRVFYEEVALQRAALAGAQWGARSVSASTDVEGMKAAVMRDLGAYNGSAEVVTLVERYCTCADEAAVDCSSGSCPGDESVSVHVMVRVARDFTMLVDYPGLPTRMTIAREAHVRAR